MNNYVLCDVWDFSMGFGMLVGLGCFQQMCVKEIVGIVVIWQVLVCNFFVIEVECVIQRLCCCVWMLFQEGLYLIDVFGVQD